MILVGTLWVFARFWVPGCVGSSRSQGYSQVVGSSPSLNYTVSPVCLAKKNQAILFYFTQNSFSEIWFSTGAEAEFLASVIYFRKSVWSIYKISSHIWIFDGKIQKNLFIHIVEWLYSLFLENLVLNLKPQHTDF